MDTCPICDGSLASERPRHRVILEVEDRTRSVSQITTDETPIRRLCVNRRVCIECWMSIEERLS